MIARLGAAAAALFMIAAACDSRSPSEPQPQPQPLIGPWSVTHVRDAAMPGAVLYVFDPAIVDGADVSAHFVVDSAKLIITADGEYTHRIRVTQWLGAVGGPPVTPTM